MFNREGEHWLTDLCISSRSSAVMKRIAALEGVQRDDELKIRERAGKLNAGVSLPWRMQCKREALTQFFFFAHSGNPS